MVEMPLKMKNEQCADLQPIQTTSIVTPQIGMLDNEKLVVEEFILCYKRNRVLWDWKCGKNVTRTEKDQVYNELAHILGKIKRDCTVEDVKKKINALRSNYRRELRKVRRSEALARDNKDAIFQPTLWWYDLMDFLEEVERPFEDVTSIYLGGNISLDMKAGLLRTDTGAKKRKHYKHARTSLPSSYCSSAEYSSASLPDPAVHEYLTPAEDMPACDDYSTSEQEKQLRIFKQEREDTNATPLANDFLDEITHGSGIGVDDGNHNANGHGAYLKPHDYNASHMAGTNNSQTPHSVVSGLECNEIASSSYTYDHLAKNYKLHETAVTREAPPMSEEYDTFIYLARLWANKLRHVQPRQRLYAEKAINDIIFEAELGTLTRNSVKINET